MAFSSTPASIEATERLLAEFADPAVDELLVNGSGAAWTVTAAGPRPFDSPFADAEALAGWMLDLAAAEGVRLDPIAGAAGGSWRGQAFRWQAVLPPLSRDGPLLALRRHRFDALTLADFGGSAVLKRRLVQVVRRGQPLLIVGPTGSGKTSLLVALVKDAAANERVVVVESTAELPSLSPFCIRLLERPPSVEGRRAAPPIGMTRLLAEALRLRPDRLIVGEIRSASEARVFLEAARTGHGGALATLHAASATEARARLMGLAPAAGGMGQGQTTPWASEVMVAVLARGGPPRLLAVDGSEAQVGPGLCRPGSTRPGLLPSIRES